jgi:hypothetical protein
MQGHTRVKGLPDFPVHNPKESLRALALFLPPRLLTPGLSYDWPAWREVLVRTQIRVFLAIAILTAHGQGIYHPASVSQDFVDVS